MYRVDEWRMDAPDDLGTDRRSGLTEGGSSSYRRHSDPGSRRWLKRTKEQREETLGYSVPFQIIELPSFVGA